MIKREFTSNRGGRGTRYCGGRRISDPPDSPEAEELPELPELIPSHERPPFYDRNEIEKYLKTLSLGSVCTKGRPNYQPVCMHTIALNVLISHHETHGAVTLSPHVFCDHLARMQILLRDVGCDVKSLPGWLNQSNLLKYLESKPWIKVHHSRDSHDPYSDSIVFDPNKHVSC